MQICLFFPEFLVWTRHKAKWMHDVIVKYNWDVSKRWSKWFLQLPLTPHSFLPVKLRIHFSQFLLPCNFLSHCLFLNIYKLPLFYCFCESHSLSLSSKVSNFKSMASDPEQLTLSSFAKVLSSSPFHLFHSSSSLG